MIHWIKLSALAEDRRGWRGTNDDLSGSMTVQLVADFERATPACGNIDALLSIGFESPIDVREFRVL